MQIQVYRSIRDFYQGGKHSFVRITINGYDPTVGKDFTNLIAQGEIKNWQLYRIWLKGTIARIRSRYKKCSIKFLKDIKQPINYSVRLFITNGRTGSMVFGKYIDSHYRISKYHPQVTVRDQIIYLSEHDVISIVENDYHSDDNSQDENLYPATDENKTLLLLKYS